METQEEKKVELSTAAERIYEHNHTHILRCRFPSSPSLSADGNDVQIIWLNEMLIRVWMLNVFCMAYLWYGSRNNLMWSHNIDWMLMNMCVHILFTYRAIGAVSGWKQVCSIRTHAKSSFTRSFPPAVASLSSFIVEIAVIWPWVMAFLRSGFLFQQISSPIIQFISKLILWKFALVSLSHSFYRWIYLWKYSIATHHMFFISTCPFPIVPFAH